jgi:hypothetical protein
LGLLRKTFLCQFRQRRFQTLISLLGFLIAAFFSAGPAVAQAVSSQSTNNQQVSYYEQGLSALAAGDRQLALKQFQLAIVYEPNNAGAWLDLALLYCEDGAIAQAEQTFRALESNFPLPEAIRQMIAYQRAQGCRAPIAKPTSALSLAAQFSAGYSSNVNAAPSTSIIRFGPLSSISFLELSSESQPKEDGFINLGFQASGHAGLFAKDQWLTSIDSRRHNSRSAFDTTHLLVGYSIPIDAQDPSKPDVSITGSVSNWWLNQKQYETTHKFSVDGWSPVWKFNELSARWGLSASTSQTLYQENPSFDAQRAEFLVRGEFTRQNWSGMAFLGPITDTALNERPGGNRTGAIAGVNLANKWRFGVSQITLAGQVQRDDRVYNELLFPGIERIGRRFFTTLRHEGNLGGLGGVPKGLTGFVSVGFERNRDSIEFFSFENQLLMIGFRGQW